MGNRRRGRRARARVANRRNGPARRGQRRTGGERLSGHDGSCAPCARNRQVAGAGGRRPGRASHALHPAPQHVEQPNEVGCDGLVGGLHESRPSQAQSRPVAAPSRSFHPRKASRSRRRVSAAMPVDVEALYVRQAGGCQSRIPRWAVMAPNVAAGSACSPRCGQAATARVGTPPTTVRADPDSDPARRTNDADARTTLRVDLCAIARPPLPVVRLHRERILERQRLVPEVDLVPAVRPGAIHGIPAGSRPSGRPGGRLPPGPEPPDGTGSTAWPRRRRPDRPPAVPVGGPFPSAGTRTPIGGQVVVAVQIEMVHFLVRHGAEELRMLEEVVVQGRRTAPLRADHQASGSVREPAVARATDRRAPRTALRTRGGAARPTRSRRPSDHPRSQASRCPVTRTPIRRPTTKGASPWRRGTGRLSPERPGSRASGTRGSRSAKEGRARTGVRRGPRCRSGRR